MKYYEKVHKASIEFFDCSGKRMKTFKSIFLAKGELSATQCKMAIDIETLLQAGFVEISKEQYNENLAIHKQAFSVDKLALKTKHKFLDHYARKTKNNLQD